MGTSIQSPAIRPVAFGQAKKPSQVKFSGNLQAEAPATGRKNELYASGGRKLLTSLGFGVCSFVLGRLALPALLKKSRMATPLILGTWAAGLSSNVFGLWGLVNLGRGLLNKN